MICHSTPTFCHQDTVETVAPTSNICHHQTLFVVKSWLQWYWWLHDGDCFKILQNHHKHVTNINRLQHMSPKLILSTRHLYREFGTNILYYMSHHIGELMLGMEVLDSLGDKFEMLMTGFRCWWPPWCLFFYIEKVTNIPKKVTSIELWHGRL